MMKAKLFYVIAAAVFFVFFHYFNANQILRSTHKMSHLEKAFHAECNINNELKVEHDDLISSRNISNLVADNMNQYITKDNAGNVTFIQEPEQQQKTPTYYGIIDLLTPKAEAITTVVPD